MLPLWHFGATPASKRVSELMPYTSQGERNGRMGQISINFFA
jgi:hypothetical protein